MAKGIKPRDVRVTNPIKLGQNKVVSPTVGGLGNTLISPAQRDPLSPFIPPVVPNVGKSSEQMMDTLL